MEGFAHRNICKVLHVDNCAFSCLTVPLRVVQSNMAACSRRCHCYTEFGNVKGTFIAHVFLLIISHKGGENTALYTLLN